MGNLGLTEILLIGVALLIFFGPSRLPELGKSLGKGIHEFKKASRELTESVRDAVEAPDVPNAPNAPGAEPAEGKK
jgi:sec-independent protein translocase protein TatA